MPPLHLPRLRHAERIRKQFLTTDTLSRQFVFNLPTHYLCFAPVLRSWQAQYGPAAVQLAALEPFTRTHYPILPQKSQSFRAALSGAARLGLLRIQGQEIVATVVGEAVAELLPDAARLAALHQKLTGSATGSTLAQLNPEAGAVLRCLLSNDPVCRFIVDRLGDAGRTAMSMQALAALSAEYDKTMAVSIFFKPESISDIVDDQGRLIDSTTPTTSVLRHQRHRRRPGPADVVPPCAWHRFHSRDGCCAASNLLSCPLFSTAST